MDHVHSSQFHGGTVDQGLGRSEEASNKHQLCAGPRLSGQGESALHPSSDTYLLCYLVTPVFSHLQNEDNSFHKLHTEREREEGGRERGDELSVWWFALE